jgi:catechol 2,3-dioxygenase-like lactoylglutathione lyase family enzyme
MLRPMLTGLAHVDLVCRDVGASMSFYRAVLGPLGLGGDDHPQTGERGETIHYLRFPGEGSGSIGLREAAGDEAVQAFALYAPGLHHIAFAVERPADVDAAHAAAVAAGAEVLHAPRRWPHYHPDYYATFFLDPDGFRVEVRSR